MKIIFRSYRFQLKPNKEQKILLDKHFGCTRYIYNYFLNERKEQYQLNKKSDNYYDQAKTLTKLKKEEDTIWLNEVNAQSLQYALRCLDTAYLNFFRGKAKFPKFKSKRNKNSFTVPQFTYLTKNILSIPKFKKSLGLKTITHRTIKGTIKKCTIIKTPIGKYYVSLLSEEQYKPIKKTGNICGIDLGIKHLAITSDGTRFKNHKYLKQYQKKLAKMQKYLSRKQKDSSSFEKQRRKVAKVYEKTSNSRIDNLHKTSFQLISKYDIICLEALNVKQMMSNKLLAKHIADASWYTFTNFLEYKANWNDKQIIKIDRFYPSSKTCNSCGWINQSLKLSDREWTCSNCNILLDRDVNAANNILKEGLKLISAGTVDYTGGEAVRLSNKLVSVKPEVH